MHFLALRTATRSSRIRRHETCAGGPSPSSTAHFQQCRPLLLRAAKTHHHSSAQVAKIRLLKPLASQPPIGPNRPKVVGPARLQETRSASRTFEQVRQSAVLTDPTVVRERHLPATRGNSRMKGGSAIQRARVACPSAAGGFRLLNSHRAKTPLTPPFWRRSYTHLPL